MRQARWLAPWKDSVEKPVIYHCVTRVVDRRFVLGTDEKEVMRTLVRMQENFTGCRVLAYCLMSNHIHLLLEVPPMRESGLSDEELLARLKAIYNQAFVADVAKQLKECRAANSESAAREIHESFTYRMHDLSEFMKTLLQRFTRWFNVRHERSGTLWESRFKSVIVEDGVASRTMAAYIDLNPVRAGIVQDPADYRWSSYGEAIGGGPKGNGNKARAGLVRALMAHKGYAADARHWAGDVSMMYRALLLEEGAEKTRDVVEKGGGESGVMLVRKGMRKKVAQQELAQLERGRDVAFGKMLRFRVRYFTDGVVIGSRRCVDGVFERYRNRFGEKRKSGARKLGGNAAPAAGVLWSARDLKKGIGEVA